MAAEIHYDGERLVLPDITCDCGMAHTKPDIDIYIGNHLLEKCVSYINKRDFGNNILLVTDNIIYPIAASKVEGLLREAGYNVILCRLDREKELVPDERALGEVLLSMEKDTDFLIAVGSGSITDITRYIAVNTGKPFVSIGTAPSMDGYTSVVAPLLKGNLKVNKPATYPKILICDLDIMKQAPYPMMISGFGDVLGKFIAKADWILGKIVNQEQYCPICGDIISQALQKCVDHIEGIKERSDEGVRSLIEALILAGLTILMIGNTRGVASIEHNMAHFWEMMKLRRGEEPPSHGTSVGVATGYAIQFYERFFQMDLKNIKLDDIKNSRESKESRERIILEKYGHKIGPAILKDNPNELPDWEEQKRRAAVIMEKLQVIKKEISFLPSFDEIRNILQKLGSPIAAHDIDIDTDLLRDALLYAKDYRDRYTIFKSANELGILEDIVHDIVNA